MKDDRYSPYWVIKRLAGGDRRLKIATLCCYLWKKQKQQQTKKTHWTIYPDAQTCREEIGLCYHNHCVAVFTLLYQAQSEVFKFLVLSDPKIQKYWNYNNITHKKKQSKCTSLTNDSPLSLWRHQRRPIWRIWCGRRRHSSGGWSSRSFPRAAALPFWHAHLSPCRRAVPHIHVYIYKYIDRLLIDINATVSGLASEWCG